jgi:hypothetical protein
MGRPVNRPTPSSPPAFILILILLLIQIVLEFRVSATYVLLKAATC